MKFNKDMIDHIAALLAAAVLPLTAIAQIIAIISGCLAISWYIYRWYKLLRGK